MKRHGIKNIIPKESISSLVISENIKTINLDLSDDETRINKRSQPPTSKVTGNNQTGIQYYVMEQNSDDAIFRACLEQSQPPPQYDTIDLDADDSDPLAPLRSCIDPSATSNTKKSGDVLKKNTKGTLLNSTITDKHLHDNPVLESSIKNCHKVNNQTGTADIANNHQDLTHPGKIIRISGQHSPAKDSSELIFTADKSSSDLVNNADKKDNSDPEMSLHTPLNTSKKVRTKYLLIPKSKTNVNSVSIKEVNAGTSDNRLGSGKKSLSPNIIDIKSMRKAGKNTCSKRRNPKRKLEEQHAPLTISHPHQEPNSTTLDLNLNINNAGSSSTTNSRNTHNSLILPNNLAGGCNVELGLVLNINDKNQSNNSRQLAPQFTSNVALDVRLNVNNEGKPATVTSNQLQQNPSAEPTYRVPYKDFTISPAGKIYCCSYCSLKTADITLITSHLCPSVPRLTETVQSSTNSEDEDDSNNTFSSLHHNNLGKIFCCNICSFKTLEFDIVKLHATHCTTENNRITQCLSGNGGIEDLLGKMYCCVACSFNTTDFEVMNSHNCPGLNKTIAIKENPNLDKIEIPSQKSSVSKRIPQENMVQNIYNCVACTFQTTDFEGTKTHNCLLGKQQKQEAGVTSKNILSKKTIPKEKFEKGKQKTWKLPKFYSCMSCSFKTTIFSLAQSHRCREGYKCEICDKQFKTKYILFQHLRWDHFGICKLFGCYLCPFNAELEDLYDHISSEHNISVLKQLVLDTPKGLFLRQLYRCTACDFQTVKLLSMKIHFDKHLEAYPFIMKLCWKSQNVLNEIPTSHKIFLYDCLLCGTKTDRIFYWLIHTCEDSSATRTRTYERKWTNKISGVDCFQCKEEITGQALKCNNSECNNIYHLKCVEVLRRWMNPEELQQPNWFCLQCKVDETFPVVEDIRNITWCMHFVNEEYLRQLQKQKSMVIELNEIKNEKVKLKTEFQEIKKFIMECKSEKINNSVVKDVCSIVETYINAGID